MSIIMSIPRPYRFINYLVDRMICEDEALAAIVCDEALAELRVMIWRAYKRERSIIDAQEDAAQSPEPDQA